MLLLVSTSKGPGYLVCVSNPVVGKHGWIQIMQEVGVVTDMQGVLVQSFRVHVFVLSHNCQQLSLT